MRARQQQRLHREWNEDLRGGVYLQAGEVCRGDTDDGDGDTVERNGFAEDGGGTAKMRGPVCFADDCDRACTGADVVSGCKDAAEYGLDAERGEGITAD